MDSENVRCKCARSAVSSRRFSRLPHYFTKHTLVSTKVVIVDPLPVPPPASVGLTRFAGFVRGNSDGIIYIDTIFFFGTALVAGQYLSQFHDFPPTQKLVKEATMSVDVFPPLNEMRDI